MAYFRRACFVVLLLFFYPVAVWADASIRFMVLTDIHFDPFVGCPDNQTSPCPVIERLRKAPVSAWPAILESEAIPFSSYWEDTSYPLLSSALRTAGQAAKNDDVRFVLVLGDELAHQFRQRYRQYAGDASRAGMYDFVHKTLLFINNQLSQTFPTVSVYSLLGNNDTYGGNYYSDPRGRIYSDLTSLWSRLMQENASRQAMRQTFPYAGYYALTLSQADGLRLLMLNTVLFSTKARGKQTPKAAERELAWLRTELQSAEQHHEPVLIAMHIPQGIDALSLFKLPLPRLVALWNESYSEQFDDIIKAHAPSIVGMMSGHIHSGGYQKRRFNDGSVIPEFGVPSISPVYGTHPSFKVYTYTPSTHYLSEFRSYYFSMNPDQPWRVADNRLPDRLIA